MGSPFLVARGAARSVSGIQTSRRDEHCRADGVEPVAILPRKRMLFHAGDPATRVVEVLSGSVALWRSLPDGRRQLVEVVGPGGYAGFSPGGVHGCDGETLTKAVVRFHAKRDLLASAERLSAVIVTLERQLDDMHRYVTMLGRMSARERIAAFLLRHAKPAIGKDAATMKLPLTRGEIGDHLGLSMETVCRIFAELGRRGVIRIGARQGEIAILRVADLRAMSEEA